MLVTRVLVASSTDQVPNDATVPAMADLFCKHPVKAPGGSV
jgi:hypothetical protein